MTSGPLSPDGARRLLHEAVEAVQPAPDAVRRIHDGYRRRRKARKIQGAVVGVAVIACAAAAAVVVPLAGQPSPPGRPAATPTGQAPSAAALAAATRAGQQAERDDSGAPVGQFGVLGPEAAWVLDGNGLFTTADAGARWAKITPPVSDPLANILCVTFSGPQDAWAIVAHPESATAMISIDRTTNGGRSWFTFSLPGAGTSIMSGTISFANSSDGFAAFSVYQQPHALLFSTSDGGANWRLVLTTVPALGGGIEFTSAADGWGISDSGRLYQTTDGGVHWSQSPLAGFRQTGLPTVLAGLPVFFGPRGVLFAVVAGQVQVDTTDDGGRSWQPHSLPFGASAQLYKSGALVPFAVPGPDVWLYFGSSDFDGKTYASVTFFRTTTDGGRTWTTILPNLGVTGIQSLVFATESNGWAVVRVCASAAVAGCEGGGGLLLFTSDGGRHFTPVRPPG